MTDSSIFTVSFAAVAVTGAVDLFEVTPADDKPIQILGFVIGQTSDPGDVQAEQIGYSIVRGNTTSGSGGTSTTPRNLARPGTTSSFTAETCNTTQAASGTTQVLVADVVNVQAGEKVWFPEGLEPQASQSDTSLTLRLAAAPADSLTMHGTLYVRELG